MNLSELKTLIKEEVNKALNPSFEIKWYTDNDKILEIRINKETIGRLIILFDNSVKFSSQQYKLSTPFFENKKICIITDVIIEPKFRGKGYSKMLLQKAIELIKSKNIDIIVLGLYSDNGAALNLYKSFGFKEYHKGHSTTSGGVKRGEIYMRLNL